MGSVKRMRGETDIGWFQRLASEQRKTARGWYALGEVELGQTCDWLASMYQQTCEMYQQAERGGR